MTGEEDEDVEAELKGVKLFVKRGSKEFADGILGHIKFLSHKTTKDERIGSCRILFCYGLFKHSRTVAASVPTRTGLESIHERPSPSNCQMQFR